MKIIQISNFHQTPTFTIFETLSKRPKEALQTRNSRFVLKNLFLFGDFE